MAVIDYDSIYLKNGKRQDKLLAGGYGIEAYKHSLIFHKEGADEICFGIAKNISRIPDAEDIRIIRLNSNDEMNNWGMLEARDLSKLLSKYSITDKKTNQEIDIGKVLKRHRDLFSEKPEDRLLCIFRIKDDVFFWLPYSPALGSATYLFILSDYGDLSLLITGYGHYQNPALHWMHRGLSKTAEDEIAEEFWKEATSPHFFGGFITGRVFNNERWNIDGSANLGGFPRDTLTDQDVRRLYNRLKELD